MSMLLMTLRRSSLALICGAGIVALSASAQERAPQDRDAPGESPTQPESAVPSQRTHGPSAQRPASRWVSVGFGELPGFFDDPLLEAWNALLTNCTKAPAAWARLCPDLRRLVWATDDERRLWLMTHLQAYRVESPAGQATGQITAYFEPELDAARVQDAQHAVPLFAPPAQLRRNVPWHTRATIDSDPAVRGQLRPILWLADPIDAQVLQIQGSGRVAIRETDGRVTHARVVFAGSNEQPFRSVGRWLTEQGLSRDGSWNGVRAWLAANPTRKAELMAANPRVVFFKEQAQSDSTHEQSLGPLGAQGVPLTAGRSVAVDRRSVPLGTPLWISTEGAGLKTQRLVVAQDVGAAISGAVRVDYFVGSGDEARDVANRIRQSFRKWALWPRGAALP